MYDSKVEIRSQSGSALLGLHALCGSQPRQNFGAWNDVNAGDMREIGIGCVTTGPFFRPHGKQHKPSFEDAI